MFQSLSHVRNRAAILWSYLAKKTVVAGGPKYVLLEATGKCNLFCPMCPRELVHFEPVDMPMPLFRKIVDEAKQFLEFAIPYGGGEPMLNPRIFEMIKFCRDRNIRVGFSTNGTMNNPERNRKLLEAGLDYLIFAFDGATKETYEKYRKGAVFEETREKILEFLRLKQELKSNTFTIIQMVRLKDNAGEVDEFRKMWNIPGIDQIRIKEDEMQFEGVAIPRPPEVPKRRNPCHYLWQGPVYIHHDGNVFPCCYMWRGQPLGNINQQELTEIWNNDKMQKLRQAHLDRKIEAYPDCVNCHVPKPRLPVILGSFLINGLAVRKLIPVFEKLALLLKVPIFETSAAERAVNAKGPGSN
jgi:radical SAM protein with 4Fe4S-binding SPASM domain